MRENVKVIKKYFVKWSGLDEVYCPLTDCSIQVESLKAARKFRKQIIKTYKKIDYAYIIEDKRIVKIF